MSDMLPNDIRLRSVELVLELVKHAGLQRNSVEELLDDAKMIAHYVVHDEIRPRPTLRSVG